MRKRPLHHAFIDAADGVAHAFIEQPNFRIQLIIAVLAIAAALVLRFDRVQWITLILTIGFVLAAELFNTCLEHVIDLIMPESHPLARSAKHAGAAAVLAASIAAAAVGVVLYGQAVAAWLHQRG
ncbi:MAG: diacylglycerol kinase family protein [Candidatus Eremiobacteraeota bacterium]|nr:diacylglycerol kinase family protein [Candidatus Eremiobacteraeota bacterium]